MNYWLSRIVESLAAKLHCLGSMHMRKGTAAPGNSVCKAGVKRKPLKCQFCFHATQLKSNSALTVET